MLTRNFGLGIIKLKMHRNFYKNIIKCTKMLNLSSKTVLITGASRGIGEAAAKTFVEAGAKVMLTARNADKLENIKRNLGDCSE